MDFIVNHPNYKDMPNKFKPNGEINWVSPLDQVRAAWWDKKKLELHCSNRAEVARLIHPKELKGEKPCQICGKKLSIYYVYPNKNSLKKINSIAPEFQFSSFNEDITNIVSVLIDSLGKKGLDEIKNIFSVPDSISNDKDSIILFIKEYRKTRLSPGAMSNPPDRLDGFHTYNACCRSLEDTGRHASNLARYTQDRRVYENWAEGNWNLSNRLMGEFNKFDLEIKCPGCGNIRKMTADHIGPISLGFTHRPHFHPLCRVCNSKKNNRMTYQDVQTLINDERKGEKVISWHSKYIWDKLKLKVKNQKDALLLSKIMRANLHHVLILFSKISEAGYDKFLSKYLHPEYSFVDYKFMDFHPLKGLKKIIEKPLDSKNKEKNAKRYVRISFESLEEYKNVQNRNTKIWKSDKVDRLINDLLNCLSTNQETEATTKLKTILKQLSTEAESIFDANSSQNLQ
jgi:Alw26I/Eco31I/Esp3I family type II restriction endonuclease